SASQTFNVATPFVQLTFVARTVNTGSGYSVTLTVKDVGNTAANSVTLTNATLGTAAGSSLPQPLGTISANGGTATAVINFPASAGAPGATVAGKVTVSSSSGPFTGTLKIVLPN